MKAWVIIRCLGDGNEDTLKEVERWPEMEFSE